jgi:hypothetical protein
MSCRTLTYRALNLKTPLGTKCTSYSLITDDYLYRTGSISEIDKCNATMISTAGDPTS